MRKEAVVHEAWLRGVSPSNALRQWFAHDPAKWEDFCTRYWAELDARPGDVENLVAFAKSGYVTLLFGSKERTYNNAEALRVYLERRLGAEGPEMEATSTSP
jgi:uncharacterized protein YeaO (DUF488 family)